MNRRNFLIRVLAGCLLAITGVPVFAQQGEANAVFVVR